MVREADTGNLVALFNLDASLDELKLRHRDITTLEVSKSGSGMGAMSPTGYTCAINDAGKLVVSSASGDIGFAQSADKYEVLNDGAAPSAASVTAGTTIAITGLGTRGSVQLRLTLMDGAGLNTKTTISDAILTLMPPVVIDKVKTNDSQLSAIHNSKNFLEYGTNKGEVEIQVPTQAYHYSGITVDQSDKIDVSGVTIKYALKESSSSTNPATQSSTTTKQLDFTTEGAYKLEVWAEKPGYESSSKSTYQIALQKTVYVSASGDDSDLGFTTAPVKTVAKAIEIINNAKVQNDWTIQILGSVESKGATVGNDLTAKSLVIQGNNSNSDIITGSSTDSVLTLDKTTTVKNVKITGGTHGIKMTASGTEVTIQDCLITENDATQDSTEANKIGGGLWVMNGHCIIKGNTTISENKATTEGCQVSVRSSGSLTMESGTISGVIDSTFDYTSDSNKKGGGVYVTGGTFTMKGGTIQNCKAYWGGGVYVTGGTFTMSGKATITNNIAGDGGGVYVDSNVTFNMSGGMITGNTAVSNKGAVIDTTTGGGGVYTKGTFNFTGGQISGNKVVKINSASSEELEGCGGGIYSSGTLSMSSNAVVGDGSVSTTASASTHSNSARLGGGIYASGQMDIFGDAIVGYNYGQSGAAMYLNGSLKQIFGKAKIQYNCANANAGGIFVNSGNLKLYENAEISNNSSGSNGSGGLLVTGGTTEIYGNAKISGNTTEGNGGGIIASSGNSGSDVAVYIYGNAVIGDSTKSSPATSTNHSNRAGDGKNGGAIYMNCTPDSNGNGSCKVYIGYKPNSTPGGNPTLDNSATPTIAYNYASMHGGGIYLASGSLTLGKGSVSYNCAAENADGGAGYGGGINAQGTFIMNGGTISNNNAAHDGGGLDIGTTCIFSSTSGTIESNTAKNGGGIAVFTSTDSGHQSTHTITGLTIRKNTATEKGGGIFVNGGSTLIANSCSIIQNHAENHGGGVSYGGGATFTNTNNSCTINGNTKGTSNASSETEN